MTRSFVFTLLLALFAQSLLSAELAGRVLILGRTSKLSSANDAIRESLKKNFVASERGNVQPHVHPKDLAHISDAYLRRHGITRQQLLSKLKSVKIEIKDDATPVVSVIHAMTQLSALDIAVADLPLVFMYIADPAKPKSPSLVMLIPAADLDGSLQKMKDYYKNSKDQGFRFADVSDAVYEYQVEFKGQLAKQVDKNFPVHYACTVSPDYVAWGSNLEAVKYVKRHHKNIYKSAISIPAGKNKDIAVRLPLSRWKTAKYSPFDGGAVHVLRSFAEMFESDDVFMRTVFRMIRSVEGDIAWLTAQLREADVFVDLKKLSLTIHGKPQPGSQLNNVMRGFSGVRNLPIEPANNVLRLSFVNEKSSAKFLEERLLSVLPQMSSENTLKAVVMVKRLATQALALDVYVCGKQKLSALMFIECRSPAVAAELATDTNNILGKAFSASNAGTRLVICVNTNKSADDALKMYLSKNSSKKIQGRGLSGYIKPVELFLKAVVTSHSNALSQADVKKINPLLLERYYKPMIAKVAEGIKGDFGRIDFTFRALPKATGFALTITPQLEIMRDINKMYASFEEFGRMHEKLVQEIFMLDGNGAGK